MNCNVVGLLVPAVLMIATPALAQHEVKDLKPPQAAKAKKGEAKVTNIMENDKAVALEILLKPGDLYKADASKSARVIRALKGGTLLRTDPDGKTQTVEWKTGQVRFFEAVHPHTGKNTGKSDLHFYVVVLK